jgi:hypothetical protein
MKQAKGDGATLQGDTAYWKNGIVLNDNAQGRTMADGNFVSAAFARLAVDGFRLQAANEVGKKFRVNGAPTTGLVAFSDAARMEYADPVGTWAPSAPQWFIHTYYYPTGAKITSARFGFNFAEMIGNPRYAICAARWGWSSDEGSAASVPGSHDSCGGLGGYGSRYGTDTMANNKGAWQPATLYLWGR